MSDWKKIVAGVAPTLATALGGPAAGIATKYIATHLLGDDKATDQEIEDAIYCATPEELARLKEIDNNFKLRMKEMDVDLHKVGAKDRQSAREMATNTTLYPQLILTLIFVGGFFALLFVIYSGFIKLDESLRDSANILLGIVAGGVPQILKFWFGGSPHDDRNLERIHRSTPR